MSHSQTATTPANAQLLKLLCLWSSIRRCLLHTAYTLHLLTLLVVCAVYASRHTEGERYTKTFTDRAPEREMLGFVFLRGHMLASQCSPTSVLAGMGGN